MTFGCERKLSVLLNQTSLSPSVISIIAGGVSLSGNFTFVPTFVNSTIMSVPNSLSDTIFYANAAIPLWSYNMVRGSLAYLPISSTIDYPSTFLELVNSLGWLAGNSTAPQTPSAFASQQYGFWPPRREPNGLREPPGRRSEASGNAEAMTERLRGTVLHRAMEGRDIVRADPRW